jgi:hypothetical protein
VALPDGAARHLGLRQSAGADPRHPPIGHDHPRRGGSTDEDGVDVRARSGHRSAVVPGAGGAGAALGCAGRGELADATDSSQATTAQPAGDQRGRPDQHLARIPGLRAARVPQVPVWPALHASHHAGHADDAGAPGRGGMAWCVVRRAAERAVRERQRRGNHQPAATHLRRHGRADAGRHGQANLRRGVRPATAANARALPR